MSIAEVEAKIRAEVAHTKAKGWRLAPGDYCLRDVKVCCVLAACVIDDADDAYLHATFPDKAATFLDIRREDAVGIMVGFDSHHYESGNEFVDLGLRLLDVVDT